MCKAWRMCRLGLGLLLRWLMVLGWRSLVRLLMLVHFLLLLSVFLLHLLGLLLMALFHLLLLRFGRMLLCGSLMFLFLFLLEFLMFLLLFGIELFLLLLVFLIGFGITGVRGRSMFVRRKIIGMNRGARSRSGSVIVVRSVIGGPGGWFIISARSSVGNTVFVEGRGLGSSSDGRLAVIFGGAKLGITPRLPDVLFLCSYWRNMALASSRFFPTGGASINSAMAPVIADA